MSLCDAAVTTRKAQGDNGLLDMLRRNHLRTEDVGDVSSFRWRADGASPRAINLQYAVRGARETAEKTRCALSSGARILILGGDCTIDSERFRERCKFLRTLVWSISILTWICIHHKQPQTAPWIGWESGTCSELTAPRET